jgi:hypothetical protein
MNLTTLKKVINSYRSGSYFLFKDKYAITMRRYLREKKEINKERKRLQSTSNVQS